MAYNEFLADRIRLRLKEKSVPFTEKTMMGGITFMVDDKMCVGIVKESLMARIDPEIYDESLTRKGCREMDFTKKPMKGFVFIDPEGYDMDFDLEYWIDLALEFNPKAKSSRKKK
ncbi:TfoX/Sxy family protein [Bacteroidota bacterium]